MQIDHFLPFFCCSIILLILFPSSKSPLHHIVLSFCSSSSCSIVLLCFCSPLSFCSASTLLYHFSLHFISFCTSSQMSHYTSFSYYFILFPFRTANNVQSHSFYFIHASLMTPLPLPIGNTRTSVLANETPTDLSLLVSLS
jgi:hypothetical protein